MRLLPDMQASAATLMATDEAILTAITENKSPPTVRFYQWTPPAVTIGYFQNPQKEVDLEYLKQNFTTCEMKEKAEKLSLVFKEVDSASSAITICKSILGK